MALAISPQPWLIFLSDDGFYVPAGQLAIYEAGTSTPATVYADFAGTEHLFPITLDGAGRIPGGLFLTIGLSYKFVLHAPRILVDLDGAILKTQDNVFVPEGSGGGGGGGGGGTNVIDVLGTLGDAVGNPGTPLYLAANTSGLWYYTNASDPATSTLPTVGLTTQVGNSNVGDIVNIRLAGASTVPGLTPGADYYLDATNGGLTTTPTAFARYMGRALGTSTLLLFANPPSASVLERITRLNTDTPYDVKWPPAYGLEGQALIALTGGILGWANMTGDVHVVIGETLPALTMVYESDGSGGLFAGRWFATNVNNDYSSIRPVIGITIHDAIAGDTIPVRLGGELDLAAPVLLAGSDYFLGVVPGSLDTVPPPLPQFVRQVGRASQPNKMIFTANPPTTAVLQRTTQINVPTPYVMHWPPTFGQEGQTITAFANGQLGWANLTGDVRGICGATILANNTVFMSNGSNGLTAGRWYPGSSVAAHSSVSPITGVSLHNGNIGDEIHIRAGGELNLIGNVLLVGADYYIGSVPGSAVTTPPAPPEFARFIGRASSANRLIISANPPIQAMVQRSMRINAPTPYQLVWPLDDGNSGQVLTTDGNGTLSWNPAGGGVPGPHAATHNTGGSDPLTALSAAILTTGQLPDARLSVNVLKFTGGYPGGVTSFLRADGTFTIPSSGPPTAHATTHNTGGSDPLTALAGEVITTGTVADVRLSSNVALKNAANVFTQNQTMPALLAQEASTPQVVFNQTAQPVDARSFRAINSGQVLTLRAQNDATTSPAPGISLDRAGVVTGSGQPRVSVTRSTTQSISNDTPTSIAWDIEVFDVGPCHAGSSGNLVVPTGGAGTYLAIGLVVYGTNTAGLRIARLRRNSVIVADVTQLSVGNVFTTPVMVQSILALNAGDVLDLQGYQNSGNPLNVEAASFFQMVKLW